MVFRTKEEFKELQKLKKIVKTLDRDLDSIIVEGYSDKQVMRKLGFAGKIFLSAEKTIEDLTEDVARGARRTAILTDFDEHGKKQNKKISHEISKEIDVSFSARNKFGKQLTSTGRRDIEDIRPLFENKNQKFIDARLHRLFP